MKQARAMCNKGLTARQLGCYCMATWLRSASPWWVKVLTRGLQCQSVKKPLLEPSRGPMFCLAAESSWADGGRRTETYLTAALARQWCRETYPDAPLPSRLELRTRRAKLQRPMQAKLADGFSCRGLRG